jgi:hypothetical protein
MEVWIIADDETFVETIKLSINQFEPHYEIFESVFDAQEHNGSPDFIFLDLGGIFGNYMIQ